MMKLLSKSNLLRLLTKRISFYQVSKSLCSKEQTQPPELLLRERIEQSARYKV